MVGMPGLLDDERRRILAFWRLLELFSPQQMPGPVALTEGAGNEQVMDWTPSSPLPWEALTPSSGGRERGPGAWRHLVFLGVYRFKDTYDWLRKISGDETEHAGRPAGRGACVGLVLDEDGRIIPESAVLSSALWAVGRIAHGQIPGAEWVEEFGAAQARLEDHQLLRTSQAREHRGRTTTTPRHRLPAGTAAYRPENLGHRGCPRTVHGPDRREKPVGR